MEITLFKGDNLVVPFQFQKNGAAQTIVGALIEFKVKKSINDVASLIDFTVGSGITIVDDGQPANAGLFNVSFQPSDTNTINIPNRRIDLLCICHVTILGNTYTTEGVLHLQNV